jgi:hypothetical protein
MMFRLQSTLADQKALNIFAEIIPGQKCEQMLTTTPISVTPTNA